MKNAFEATVVDLPRQMLIQYPHMVHDAHVAVVVSELIITAANAQTKRRVTFGIQQTSVGDRGPPGRSCSGALDLV